MRRVLAAVLPEVALVLARRRVPESRDPLAVVVDPESAIVAAADGTARRAGVKVGQGVAAATVRASGLRIVHVAREEIASELELVLEVLAELGPTVAFRLEREREGLEMDPTYYDDTAWVDVTGATALAGGEKALVAKAHARIDAIGHRARLALASGPRIARALARYGEEPLVIARNLDHERRLFSALPLHALPLSLRARTFFRRVGLATVGDLAGLSRDQVSARLEADPQARAVLDLLDLRDEVPLVPWTPARIVSEQQAFEDGVEGTEALVFVLRGMTSRLGQRLAARGEATGKLVLGLSLDRSILRLARGEDAPARVELVIALPVPLVDPDALLRTLVPSLERTELGAPVVALSLVAEDVVRARRDQLDLSRGRGIDPHRLRNLATELGVELGEGHVGFFQVLDAHRPELRSKLALDGVSIRAALAREDAAAAEDIGDALIPTRLLPEPIAIERFVPGARLVVNGRAHRVERVVPLARLERVEWWVRPVTREYVRVSLVAEQGGERSEALVFHDRIADGTFLHGWME
jgi:protein ImuB